MKVLFIASAVVFGASSVSAMPVADFASHSSMVQNARIVCEQSGQCYRPPARRPVARWIYGDRAFSGPGPFVGPGNYGWPNWHYRWWWF